MSRGLRNNNPGNIRLSGTRYIGEKTPSADRAFKQFRSMAYGYRAMFVILRTYQKKYGLRSISAMVRRWAPESENDTRAYINSVSLWSGISRDAPIDVNDKVQMCAVVAAMSRMENGVKADMKEVYGGWELL